MGELTCNVCGTTIDEDDAVWLASEWKIADDQSTAQEGETVLEAVMDRGPYCSRRCGYSEGIA